MYTYKSSSLSAYFREPTAGNMNRITITQIYKTKIIFVFYHNRTSLKFIMYCQLSINILKLLKHENIQLFTFKVSKQKWLRLFWFFIISFVLTCVMRREKCISVFTFPQTHTQTHVEYINSDITGSNKSQYGRCAGKDVKGGDVWINVFMGIPTVDFSFRDRYITCGVPHP